MESTSGTGCYYQDRDDRVCRIPNINDYSCANVSSSFGFHRYLPPSSASFIPRCDPHTRCHARPWLYSWPFGVVGCGAGGGAEVVVCMISFLSELKYFLALRLKRHTIPQSIPRSQWASWLLAVNYIPI